MTVFDRIAIGVANWNEKAPYGHRGVVCPRSEQEEIISYCMSAGIHTIHTKKAYNVDLGWVPTCFDVVWSDELPNTSVYTLGDTIGPPDKPYGVLQVPYSPFNRTCEAMFGGYYRKHFAEMHARSIFVQGKVFTSDESVFVRFRDYAAKVGLPVGTLCILFCLLNPNVDKVIIGVDSEEQLRENLRFFHRLDGFGVDDPAIIDPRIFAKGK